MATRRALIVEDDPEVREVTVTTFEVLGFDVVSAANAQEALAIFDTSPVIDVLFTDVRMPGGLDGFGLVRQVRAKHPQMRVIYTSGYPGVITSPAETFEHGPFLAKPWTFAELQATLNTVLDATEPGHETVVRTTRRAG